MYKQLTTLISIIIIFVISCAVRVHRPQSFIQGEKKYYNQKFVKALPLLLRAHREEPKLSTTCFYLANIYNHLRQPSQALSFYKKGLLNTDKPAHYYFNIGLTFFYLKKYKKAVDNFALALKADPGLVNAHLDMGLAYFRQGDLKKTISHWELYMKSSPTNKQVDSIQKAILILRKRISKQHSLQR